MQPPGSRRQVRLALPSLTGIKPVSQRSRAYNPRSPKFLSRQSVSETPQKQMCKIEQFDVVYPNGYRERREQEVSCRRRTRGQPCRGAEVVRLRDRLASASEHPPIQPHIVTIKPRDPGNSRRHSSSWERKRDPITGVTLNFKFWNPFSSKKERGKKFYVMERKRRQPDPPIPPPPVVPPFQPPGGRGRRSTPITIHQSSEEDEDESSSPPEANRQHGRRTRSLSSIRRYEAEKERIRQQEFRERERRERNRREEREARDRAERLERQRARDEERERVASLERRREREERRERVALLERLERQREIDEQREREERRQERRRERLAAEQEAIRQREARIQQEREDRERWRAARRAQQLREDIARRRWEEEEFARRRAADRAAEERARYRYAEQRRRDRERQANIPLYPRYPVFVHHDNLDRGDRVIRDDIEAENWRQFDRRAERLHGRYDDGWLRRHNTVDGGRRWHDGYWRDRY